MRILYSELLLSQPSPSYCYINRIAYTHMIVKNFFNVSFRNECQKIHSKTEFIDWPTRARVLFLSFVPYRVNHWVWDYILLTLN